MKREGPRQLSNQLNPFHLAVRAEWSIDNPFELRTQSKKEKRRSCRPFPGHFADHFRSSCRFPVFRPCFCSPPVPRQIGSSIYRQIGLTNISVSDVISGLDFLSSSLRTGRPSHPSRSPWFPFWFAKRRWKSSPTAEPNQLEQPTYQILNKRWVTGTISLRRLSLSSTILRA